MISQTALRNYVMLFLVPALASALQAGDSTQHVSTDASDYRAPTDVGWLAGHLFVANSKSGSVSKIDVDARQVVGEWTVAESLGGLAVWRGGLLLLDDHTHRLIHAVERPQPAEHPASMSLEIVRQIDVPEYPVDVVVNGEETSVAVSSLWSRTLLLLESEGDELQVRHQIDLPFAPRSMFYLPNDKLAVADSFGGQLALVDCSTGTIEKQHTVYGHNIRGLGLNHKDGKLLVACQTLDPATFTTYERVFWGVLMQNGLHSIPLDELVSQSGDARDTPPREAEYSGTSYSSRQRYPLGTPSIGSGDPGAVVVTKDDTTLVLISGVNQVAFRTASHMPFERLKTERRPEAICLDESEDRAFISNRFSDSITVVSLKEDVPIVESTIVLGKMRELTLAEKGEQTFYDASVSLDGWFSCHSCHTDGHTNGQLADTFGDEDRGAPKKVISLLGSADAGPWGWNGTKEHIEEQISTSLIISMQSQIPTEELPIDQLVAYLKTLNSPPSVREAREQPGNAEQLAEAHREFETVGCRQCHTGTAYTADQTFDVGLVDEQGEYLFNPPSLKGVSQRAPYFHDGRANSVDDVLKSSHHNPETQLTEEQRRRLALLLESL